MENNTLTIKIWEVQFLSPPPVMRYCKKCGRKSAYHSSGQFRINAQRKYLDIWLIYKCSECDTSWNLPIFSRINPKTLSSELLNKFHSNDKTLADQYAMDSSLLRRNGCEIGSYDYQVIGDTFFDSPIKLHIKSNYVSHIRVSEILRKTLHLSRKAFDDMVSDGKIQNESGEDLRKCKLNKEIIIIVS